ncbi:MAG: family 78 glycoside hydrolase catalytic domain [Clostridia bacterium]|nr:family 78 glycoside hydrolase catalytic domain [Clostridia bacterium]
MLKIANFTCERLKKGCVTDNPTPTFAYFVESDREGVHLIKAEIACNGATFDALEQTGVPYRGSDLHPFTVYTATLAVEDNFGDRAEETISFETGRLNTPWKGSFISDGAYSFTEKKTSPVPMNFKKEFAVAGEVKSVKVYATAIGIYDLFLNGSRVGKHYFAPGFTSYPSHLQYQTYDLTDLVQGENELSFTVGGGWAVGAFVFSRVNRVTAKRQALLAEIRIEYADGRVELFGTDESWDVTMEGKMRFSEFYDGEVYDAGKQVTGWHKASLEKLSVSPKIEAQYGLPVTEHEHFQPISVTKAPSGELVYDFGQNMAGIVKIKVNGKKGQVITVRHAEILTREGELNVAFLRSAKCRYEYTCIDGEQEYAPTMTYMGFRYASVKGIDEKDILSIEAVALYSDLQTVGSFSCSNAMLNQLQSNIVWGGKSNFVDIPTDCPQRDERMGWTGDIAVFAPTACYNFDMSRFLDKWLKDVKSEQTRGGGIPNTVPVQGYGFPVTMPKKAIAFWGDACIYVPWAEYLAHGDVSVLKKMYPTMKKYLKACTFWAKLFSFGKNKYIWNDIPAMQFGDWVAPDVPQMGQWQARCKWTGTASIAYSSSLVAKIAHILGEEQDELYYTDLYEKTSDAYVSLLTDGNGKLLNEFQTAYVLPLQFKMFRGEARKKAAANLVELIKKNDYCIGTGFPGTPFILFALADNGYPDVAYKMLLNTKCPSWLYEVKVGATTIWERWDGLDENGVCTIGDDGTGGMISFNHYAFGAVGDFLYRRVVGIEAKEGGYKTFRVEPLVGGDLDFAKGSVITAYGKIESEWKKDGDRFTLTVIVPVGTKAEVILPSRETEILESGTHTLSCNLL